MNVKNIRQDFPILKRKVNGKRLVYLDSTATSQKPKQVIEAITDFYETYNANVHRGIHKLSEEATEHYESSRKKIAAFISARPDEIVFTRNATESINLVANSLDWKKGDEIVTTIMEHHSNIVPWLELKDQGMKVKFVDINDDGTLKMEQFGKLITKNTKLVAVTGCSNVLGTINPLAEISKIAHDNKSLLLIDAAQSAAHTKLDVAAINADFVAFSGHKMLAPTGIGALFAKKSLLEKMKPFMKGGDMIKEVTTESATWNDVPYKFEAGTPNVAGAIGFGAAIDYINRIGIDSIRQHEKELIGYALKLAEKEKKMTFYGTKHIEERAGILTFNFENIHGHDVATILDQEGIAIRSGHLCAQPLMSRLSINSACRASFYLYTTEEEIDILFDAFKNVRKVFRID
jgi:cysteine desulfurase/selenocysteine lyase